VQLFSPVKFSTFCMPSAKTPDTKKVFAGITSAQEITDLWAYLEQFDAEGNIKK
jgi:cytochrome c